MMSAIRRTYGRLFKIEVVVKSRVEYLQPKLLADIKSVLIWPTSGSVYTEKIQKKLLRGVQYAAGKYIETLKENGIIVSMTRQSNPYDNAIGESFIKTLKHEEVLLNEYENFHEAYYGIAYFINEIYNKRQLHSALGYESPVELKKYLRKEDLRCS